MGRRRAQHCFSLPDNLCGTGYRGSETSVRNFITSLRKEIGPRGDQDGIILPSRKSETESLAKLFQVVKLAWLVLRRQEDLASEDQHTLDLLMQGHEQIERASKLAQAFALMVRERNAPALQSWLQEADRSGIAELRTKASGIRRDQAAVLAALTYQWSQGQVEGQVHRLKLLKRQSYERAGFDLLRHRVLARSA